MLKIDRPFPAMVSKAFWPKGYLNSENLIESILTKKELNGGKQIVLYFP